MLDRVMRMKLKTESMMTSVVSAYAPQAGCEKSEEFLSELDEGVDK